MRKEDLVKWGLIGSLIVGIPIGAKYALRNEPNQNTADLGIVKMQKSKLLSSIPINERDQLAKDLSSELEIPFSSGVVYDHDGSKILDHIEELMKAEPDETIRTEVVNKYRNIFLNRGYSARVPYINISGKLGYDKAPIFLGKLIFEHPVFSGYTVRDLRSVVEKHEHVHCEQNAKGYWFVEKEDFHKGIEEGRYSGDLIANLRELDAMKVQVDDMMSNTELSRRYKLRTLTILEKYYGLALQELDKSPTEGNKKLFRRDMQRLEDLPEFEKLKLERR